MMITALFLAFSASAALFTGAPGDSSVEYVQAADKGSLTLVGKGLRKKKVAFVNVKVYDTFVYATDPATFQRQDADAALASLSGQKASAIQLKFLRDVDADRIVSAFRESLEANKIDVASPAIKGLLDKVRAGGEIKEGQTMTILILKGDPEDSVIYENGKGDIAVVKGPAGLGRQILSIWFGATPEGTMQELKGNLLKQP